MFCFAWNYLFGLLLFRNYKNVKKCVHFEQTELSNKSWYSLCCCFSKKRNQIILSLHKSVFIDLIKAKLQIKMNVLLALSPNLKQFRLQEVIYLGCIMAVSGQQMFTLKMVWKLMVLTENFHSFFKFFKNC